MTFVGNATTLIAAGGLTLLTDFTREMQRRGMADRIIEVPRGASVTV